MTVFLVFLLIMVPVVCGIVPPLVLLAFKFNLFKPLEMYLDWLEKKLGL